MGKAHWKKTAQIIKIWKARLKKIKKIEKKRKQVIYKKYIAKGTISLN
jgi:hypothetical protein